MGIYLLSLSHKTTPLSVRSLFSYSEGQKELILKELTESGIADEAVVLSTCNRMELYCHGTERVSRRQIFQQMENTALKAAGVDHMKEMSRYILRFYEEKAVHHLFAVAAGLDSMVIGEDQILGQVKLAYEFSKERGYCGACFHTMFREAVTGAKKVKTETLLSKTPVSTASLAIKAAAEHLGGWPGKRVMIIGATGKIGSVILKNLQGIGGVSVYVTIRNHSSIETVGHQISCTFVPYESRYDWMDEMDVVISATTSPHYTVTQSRLETCLHIKKERVFIDLAVPADMEAAVEELPGIWFYNIDHMTELARQNNEKKQAEVKTAERIIKDYEDQFLKWQMFRSGENELEQLKEIISRETCEKGMETAVNRFLYRIRENSTAEELKGFLSVVEKVNREVEQETKPEKQKKRDSWQQAVPRFPLFVSIEGKKVLVAGAGAVATRRGEILSEFGADVKVVAPEGSDKMKELESEGMIAWERRAFQEQDLEQACLVVAATGDAALNNRIAGLCKEKQIPVNHAGDKSQCDFYFPGIAREGQIVAGVTTSGNDPGLAREITGKLRLWMGRYAGRQPLSSDAGEQHR